MPDSGQTEEPFWTVPLLNPLYQRHDRRVEKHPEQEHHPEEPLRLRRDHMEVV